MLCEMKCAVAVLFQKELHETKITRGTIKINQNASNINS